MRLRRIVVSFGIVSTGNGHDPATKQMVEILLRMEASLRTTNESIAGLTSRMDVLTSRVDVLHEDMLALRADVTGIRNEMRSLRPELRADLDHMQERIARLEAVVFKPAAE
jgi:hypothetical protein